MRFGRICRSMTLWRQSNDPNWPCGTIQWAINTPKCGKRCKRPDYQTRWRKQLNAFEIRLRHLDSLSWAMQPIFGIWKWLAAICKWLAMSFPANRMRLPCNKDHHWRINLTMRELPSTKIFKNQNQLAITFSDIGFCNCWTSGIWNDSRRLGGIATRTRANARNPKTNRTAFQSRISAACSSSYSWESAWHASHWYLNSGTTDIELSHRSLMWLKWIPANPIHRQKSTIWSIAISPRIRRRRVRHCDHVTPIYRTISDQSTNETDDHG